MKEISEKTVIPISLAITILAGVVWFFVVYEKDMRDMSDRLSRIEGKLGIYYAQNKGE